MLCYTEKGRNDDAPVCKNKGKEKYTTTKQLQSTSDPTSGTSSLDASEGISLSGAGDRGSRGVDKGKGSTSQASSTLCNGKLATDTLSEATVNASILTS